MVRILPAVAYSWPLFLTLAGVVYSTTCILLQKIIKEKRKHNGNEKAGGIALRKTESNTI